MGYSSYSSKSYDDNSRSFATKSMHQIFAQTEVHETMATENLGVREARDNENHPHSFPIIIALDVTGSMGYIPTQIIKEGLGDLVSTILSDGHVDPAILFMAVGDHFSDRSPIQVGQFESGDIELVNGLKNIHIERGGGANGGESYLLAWYAALKHTITDAWEKRGQKGILITIGDEKCHSVFENPMRLFGGEDADSYGIEELYDLTSEKWDIFHIHADDGSYSVESPRGRDVIESWENVVGDKVKIVADHKNIPKEIAKIISNFTALNSADTVSTETWVGNEKEEDEISSPVQML